MVLTASAMVGTQQDIPFRTRTRTRAPGTLGFFASQTRLTVGAVSYVLRTEGTVVTPDIAVSVNGLDISNGGRETIPRIIPDAFDRTYVIANVGQAPLHVGSYAFLDKSFAFLRLLPPGTQTSFTVPIPVLDLGIEPLRLFIESDDPDESLFAWTAVSKVRGRPALAVSVGNGISRGDSVRENGRVFVVLRNAGDEPLTITALGESCTNCSPAAPIALPVVLAPGEEFSMERTTHPLGKFVLTFNIESDDPDGPFSFEVKHRISVCSLAPGPLLVLLALTLLRRRRA